MSNTYALFKYMGGRSGIVRVPWTWASLLLFGVEKFPKWLICGKERDETEKIVKTIWFHSMIVLKWD